MWEATRRKEQPPIGGLGGLSRPLLACRGGSEVGRANEQLIFAHLHRKACGRAGVWEHRATLPIPLRRIDEAVQVYRVARLGQRRALATQ